jgi:predicted phosphodiesterase
MNRLLFTDPHLTDNPLEAYRWNIFKTLEELAIKHQVSEIDCLGDLVDRKDYHSRTLINGVIDVFSHLQSFTKADIKIISGNHDAPTTGLYYWKFLNKLGIKYIQEPELHDGVYFLPFTSNPEKDWEKLNFKGVKTLFMHQCVSGSLVENDRVLSGCTLPLSVNNFIIYSGDIHRPQTVGNVIYIGTPHPVKFSESWPNRVILIKDDCFAMPIDIWLDTTKRAILDIASSQELMTMPYKKGDQVRIRYHLTGKQLTQWPEEQKVITKWGSDRGIHIASTESILIGDGVKANTNKKVEQLELMKPAEVVRTFGADEKLSSDVIDMGVALLEGI